MRIVWALVAAVCALAFGFVTGVVRPHEKVNGLWLVVAAGCCYALAFRYYARFLARRVMELNDRRATPAHRLHDGTNFYPANKYVLFGHHFAAISASGPLIGPVLAAQFGYLPGALWILFGAALGGAVHDFIILFASVRHGAAVMSVPSSIFSGGTRCRCISARTRSLFVLIARPCGVRCADTELRCSSLKPIR